MTSFKKLIFLFLSLLFFYFCSQHTDTASKEKQQGEQSSAPEALIDVNVALTFINDYVDFCSKMKSEEDAMTFISNHPLLTSDFKNKYHPLLDSARKEDPELGLGVDPILDAQDFPEKGFVIRQSDQTNGYVTLEGKHWPDFTLVIKLVKQNGQSLVDGCGIINIDGDKRAKR